MRIPTVDQIFSDIDMRDTHAVHAYAARLAKQKGLLEIVFNTIHEGIIVVDRSLRIKYHNQTARELLGLPEDLEHVRLSQFLKDVALPVHSHVRKGNWRSVSRYEVEILYPEHRLVQFYIVPHEHETGDATVILRDITEQNEKTAQHIETEKLRMVSMLAAGVAHEIGNPLNSIYLHLQLMQRNVSRGKVDLDDFSEMLETAQKEVERLDGIIRQFLAALRPGKPQFSPVRLSLVTADCLKLMWPEFEEKSIVIHTELPEYIPVISGDEGQLKQMIFNLLKNALQAMAPGGSLTVRCFTDDEAVSLEVRDTGMGIPPEEISQIFDPFHTTKKTGTGLGLMVVERVVREHGAQIYVESKPNEGTAFIVKFPLSSRMNVRRLLPSVEPE